jgi:hypothetical protein
MRRLMLLFANYPEQRFTLGHSPASVFGTVTRYTVLASGRFKDFWRMSVLIHEQNGRRTIYYPDDRHLRQYADSSPTLVSVEIWTDAASAENAFRDGLVTWENDPHPPDASVAY